MFCLTGLVIGTITGYYVGIHWKPTSQHVRHIKTIACYHYYGIEVHLQHISYDSFEYRYRYYILLLL